MARDDVILTVWGRSGPIVDGTLDCLPFGVRVLKLRVQRNQERQPTLGPVWLRPLGYQPPNRHSLNPDEWRVYGTAVNDPDLWIAWGAGDENGFAVKSTDRFKVDKVALPLDDDDAYFLYFHLIHRPADPFNHVLTEKRVVMQAVDNTGEVVGETAVNLTIPQHATNPLRPHWHTDWANGHSEITLRADSGRPIQCPRYLSRWWGSQRLTYEPIAPDSPVADFANRLRIQFDRQDGLGDRSRLAVWLGDEPLAELDGDIALPLHDMRLCNVELFQFPDDTHLVLRFWFYWLHLRFAPDQLLTFVPPDQLAAQRPEAERVAQLLDHGLLPWHRREEVPDVERFDLLLNPAQTSVKFVGTDTHWKEYWAVVDAGEPLQARIATKRDLPWIGVQQLQFPATSDPVLDPLANGLCDLINDAGQGACPHRGVGHVVKQPRMQPGDEDMVCQQCQTRFRGQPLRALGMLWGKHGPLPKNAAIIPNAISSDVLKG